MAVPTPIGVTAHLASTGDRAGTTSGRALPPSPATGGLLDDDRGRDDVRSQRCSCEDRARREWNRNAALDGGSFDRWLRRPRARTRCLCAEAAPDRHAPRAPPSRVLRYRRLRRRAMALL